MPAISILSRHNFVENDFTQFFESYKLEDFYRLNLNIDEKKFQSFLIQKLKRRVDSENGNFWTIKKDGGIIGVFGLEEDTNSSKHYNKVIYNLSSFYNFTNHAADAFILIKNKIEEYRTEHHIDYIKCKVDLADHKNISYLLSDNFHYYAASQKIYLDFDTYGYPNKIVKRKYQVRNYDETTDLVACLKLIRQHNQNERYYNQDFAVDQTRIIFEEWFKNQSKNEDSTTLVLCDATLNDKIIGVSIYTNPKQFNNSLKLKIITWDIIVLDEKARGNGLTTLLFSEIISREKRSIEGSTMSDNLMLQKFAHKFGFFVVGSFVYLRKRYY